MNTYVAPDELEGNQVLKSTYKETKLGVVYKGVVKNNNDPLMLGRVQVLVSSLYTGMSDEDLPWAQPCFFSASYESGTFIVPRVGNLVWVLFENNDKFKPVYIGSMYTSNLSNRTRVQGERVQGAKTQSIPDEVTSSDIEVLYKSENSGIIYFDRDSLHLLSPIGVGLEISDDNLSLKNRAGSSLNIENEIIELEYGSTKIRLDGKKAVVISSDSKVEIMPDKITLISPVSVVSVGSNVKVTSGKCSVTVSGGTVTSSVGGSTVKQTSSTIDLSATTVNINASVINME